MSIRNVILLILGTVGISVLSVVITLRMTQTKTPAGAEAPIPQQQAELPQPTQKVPALPEPGPNQARPTQNNKPPAEPPPEDLSKALEAISIPKEFQRGPPEQIPLTADKVVDTLMKETPACHDEYKSLCTKNRFLAEHPLACLRSKKDQLSRACFSQLTAVRERFHQECGADIKRLCPNEASYFVCLKKHLNELSPTCRNNISKSSRQ